MAGLPWLEGSARAQSNWKSEWTSLKNDFREILSPLAKPRYSLELLEHTSSEKRPANTDRLVIVIGGLQTGADAAKRFANQLSKEIEKTETTQFAIFEYPNDGSMETSGQVLRKVLAQIARRFPQTKISLVGHSMGGLVARSAIEPTEDIAAGGTRSIESADQLILICPPNQGSVLAQYADALELADFVSKLGNAKHSLADVAFSLIDDGLGEACEELQPNSPFLTNLNQCQRAPGVRYTIFAGNQGPLPPLAQLVSGIAISELQRGAVRTSGNEASVIVEQTLDCLRELLQSDELAQGRGDGAVSVESARLAGVNDFRVVPINHTHWCEVERPAVADLVRKIARKIDNP
jgi:pimeloyl-ACP methyl ester carboxylesterase